MSLSSFDLSGKVALVTGVSTGLGAAIAAGLAGAGADIVGIYNTSEPSPIADNITALGRRFIGVRADMRKTSSAKEIISQALMHSDHIDILVNNAGIIRRNSLFEFNEADWDDVMNVNLKSLFFLSQAVARHQAERHIHGKIINIASMLSFQGGIRVPSYTASKHGVLGLTRLMANELAPTGINVNAIAPGYMVTENTRPLREDAKRNADILARIPAGRWGSPEDLQGAAIFLASRASDYLFGTVIPVDGGWLCR